MPNPDNSKNSRNCPDLDSLSIQELSWLSAQHLDSESDVPSTAPTGRPLVDSGPSFPQHSTAHVRQCSKCQRHLAELLKTSQLLQSHFRCVSVDHQWLERINTIVSQEPLVGSETTRSANDSAAITDADPWLPDRRWQTLKTALQMGLAVMLVISVPGVLWRWNTASHNHLSQNQVADPSDYQQPSPDVSVTSKNRQANSEKSVAAETRSVLTPDSHHQITRVNSDDPEIEIFVMLPKTNTSPLVQ